MGWFGYAWVLTIPTPYSKEYGGALLTPPFYKKGTPDMGVLYIFLKYGRAIKASKLSRAKFAYRIF
jgi:hypothetical protein